MLDQLEMHRIAVFMMNDERGKFGEIAMGQAWRRSLGFRREKTNSHLTQVGLKNWTVSYVCEFKSIDTGFER
jgi:hypothetical protein